MIRMNAAFLGMAFVVASTGCGRTEGRLAVTGSVTFDGKPL
ncbi:MAG: hypothetical protein ACKO4T_06325 [Planctomycetaceae bacterium]